MGNLESGLDYRSATMPRAAAAEAAGYPRSHPAGLYERNAAVTERGHIARFRMIASRSRHET
jgi:hypothetical protein